jgi:hypothetical protein
MATYIFGLCFIFELSELQKYCQSASPTCGFPYNNEPRQYALTFEFLIVNAKVISRKTAY